MAEDISFSGMSEQTGIIISAAKEKLILIGPYLGSGNQLRPYLEEREALGRETLIVLDLRPSDLHPGIHWLSKLEFARTNFLAGLLDEFYVNETDVLVTSKSTHRIGAGGENGDRVISHLSDPQLFQSLSKLAESLVALSQGSHLYSEDGFTKIRNGDQEITVVDSYDHGV